MSTFSFLLGLVVGAAFVALMWWFASSDPLDIEGDSRERSD